MSTNVLAQGLYVPTSHVVLSAVRGWCFNMESAPRSRKAPIDDPNPDERAMVELFCPNDDQDPRYPAGDIAIGYWHRDGRSGDWRSPLDFTHLRPVAWRYLRHAPAWDFAERKQKKLVDA